MKKTKRFLSAALVIVLTMVAIFSGNVKIAAAEEEMVLNAGSISTGDYTSPFEVGDFTIHADSTNPVSVDAKGKAFNNVTYKNRLKTGGAGGKDYRSISFEVTKASSVEVICVSSNSSQTRTMDFSILKDDGTLSVVKTASVGTSLALYKFDAAEAGTYYLYSESGGINFQCITVKDAAANPPVVRDNDEVREQAPDFKTGDLYVSVTGKDTATGSFEDPMDFVTAVKSITEGNTIWMFSGTYYFNDTYGDSVVIEENNSGSDGKYKTISSINGKRVTIDFDGMPEDSAKRGIVLDGSYWHFYDIDICNAGDNGMLLSGDNNIIELCQFYSNHDTGLQLSRYNTSYASVSQWPSNNLILNCTAFNNKDDKTAENADGFAAKLTCGEGNVFDGCISYCNSDDGWDLYAKTETGPIGVVTIRNCVAFGNGKLTNGEGSAKGDMNGFKLGGSGVATPHIVENCLSFNNGATGFTDNNNPEAIKLSNCSAVYNGAYDANKANYMCYRSGSSATYTNLVSFVKGVGASTDQFKGTLTKSFYHYKDLKTNNSVYWVESNTFDGSKVKYTGTEAADKTITAADFVNTVIPGFNESASTYETNYHEIFRNEDGSIYLNGLFEIKEDSPLYTAGVDGKYLGAKFAKTEAPVLPGDVTNTTDETKNAFSAKLTNSLDSLKAAVLTETDLAAIANGSNCEIYAVVSLVENADASDKALVEAMLSEGKVAKYLDIKLYKKIGNDVTAVTSTKEKIKLQLTL
ncbi:MAG: hypothetical protein ACI4EV_00405, partial [Lachnospiraceae bacterium]